MARTEGNVRETFPGGCQNRPIFFTIKIIWQMNLKNAKNQYAHSLFEEDF